MALNEKVLFRHDDPHGVGTVLLSWQPGNSVSYLATSGSDCSVAIFNRQGVLQERIILQGVCSGLAWDCEGDLLGIITQSNSQLLLWDSNSKKKQYIEIGLRDSPTCIVWSKNKQIVGVATSRGNLSIYNHQSQRRIPILGKHSKKITGGCWSEENLLALISEDKTMSINTEEGDTLKIVQLRDSPSDIHFSRMKIEDEDPGDNTISVILGKRTLFLYHIPEPDAPIELGFQQHYGQLVQHKWFGEGFILLGFALGHIVTISTNPKEVGQELWQVKNHRDSLSAIDINMELGLLASCGDNNVKIHSTQTKDMGETIKILSTTDQIRSISWCTDGQLLALSTMQGSLHVFVTKLNTLHAVFAPKIAVLSNLSEVSIFEFDPDRTKSKNKLTYPTVIVLEVEPDFLSVGPAHLACGLNNHVWFYDLGKSRNDTALLLGDREYRAQITDIKMNSSVCSVLCGGHIMLHCIETTNEEIKEPQIFPEAVPGLQNSVISCQILTENFLAFATDMGNIVYFSLDQWIVSTQVRYKLGIKKLFTDREGVKLIYIDDSGDVFLHVPGLADTEYLQVPDIPKNVEGFLWDFVHPNLFIGFSKDSCSIYYFARYSISRGPTVEKLDEMKLMSDQIPVLLSDGELVLNSTSSGHVSTTHLKTHKLQDGPKSQLKVAKQIRKFDQAWDACRALNDKEEWLELGKCALRDLDINLAIKIYRHIGDVATVNALEEIRNIEDLNLLSGFCAMFLGQTDLTQQYFIKSAAQFNFNEALELCRDLLLWEQAMALAANVAPREVFAIAREYGHQLEFTGNYREALMHYEKSINYTDPSEISVENLQIHDKLANSGIARTSILNKDYRKGINIAVNLNDKQLYQECAQHLRNLNQIQDSALLYEKGEFWDEACELYIELKQWKKVEKLLPHTQVSKLHLQFAKARESEGKYEEAIASYKTGGDLDSAVRIYLDNLNDPHSAQEIVSETKSSVGSKLLARFYQQIGDIESAVQYLIQCDSIEEALSLSRRHNKLKVFGELLEKSDNAKPKNFKELAELFENEKYTLLTGKYYFLAKEYEKAMKYLLKASVYGGEEDTNALSLAIDCVAVSNDPKLTNQMIEFLLGESDGVPKDPKFLFRLYMARKEFKEAAKTAVIIANQEQLAGNYRSAHDLLFSMNQELREHNLQVGSDMKTNLNLLHRYILVRIHVKLSNHKHAARLLSLVAENISQFPSHIVPILTSTVIECQRAGFRQSAFRFATQLMRSEHRQEIDDKYKKKIEGIVRKAPKNLKDEEEEVDSSPCPICDTELRSMELSCYQCKETLPICIATGQHIIPTEMVLCPECRFPCIKDVMVQILDATNLCPMCSNTVDSNKLLEVDDVKSLLM